MDEKTLARRIALETEQLRLESEIDATQAEIAMLMSMYNAEHAERAQALAQRVESYRDRLGAVRQELAQLDQAPALTAAPPQLDGLGD